MKIGICGSAQDISLLKEGTADYAELNLTSLAQMSAEEFKDTKALLAAKSISAEATNCFFPGTIKLCGKDMDINRIKDYTKGALLRAAELGIHTCVLGSGGARKIEEGEIKADCQKQLDEVFYAIGDYAKEYETTVVIEPLNKGETNVINTVTEGAAMARRVNHPHILLLADIYHVEVEKEPLSVIYDNGDLLRHVHIANPAGRLFPKAGDGYDYEAVKQALAKANYDLRISIEGAPFGEWRESAEESLAFLKSIFQ